MTGDFMALLGKGVFPSFAAGGPGPMPLEATTVFAFHCSEGVIICGDHRATAGNTVFSDKTEKILELDSHSLMAIAGVPATAFEMARTLQTAFQFYRRSQLQPMSLAAKIRALSRLLRENLPATLQGIGAVSPIFAGAEPDGQALGDTAVVGAAPGLTSGTSISLATVSSRSRAGDSTGRPRPVQAGASPAPLSPPRPAGRPVICFYDPLGAHFEAADFAASGSGSAFIRSVLHYLLHWGRPRPEDMPLAEASVLAIRLLMTAAEFDTATGGVHPEHDQFATLKLLSAHGVRTVSAEEQARYWKEAAA